MDTLKYACDDCCRNCVELHHQKQQDGSFRISSFFKIMFGKKIADELIVPPKFARTLEPLVGEKFYFEDASGLKWHAILADLGQYLGFQKGWCKFFGDHDIEIGDLVVFHYVKESYFQVKIYGRTGCQKVFSDDRTNQEKGHKVNSSSIPQRSSRTCIYGRSVQKRSFNNYVVNVDSDSDLEVIPRPKIQKKEQDSRVLVRNNSASKVISREKHKLAPAVKPSRVDAAMDPTNMDLLAKPSNRDPILEPCFMTNRDMEDDSDRLIDLSTLEMPLNKTTSDREDIMRFTLDMPFLEAPANGPESSDREDGKRFSLDMPFQTPENEPDANETGKSQGNASSQVSDTLQHAQTEADLTNIDQCQIPEENTEAQSENGEAHMLGPEGTSIPSVELPVSSNVPAELTVKPNDFEHTLPVFTETPDNLKATLPQSTATANAFKFITSTGGTMKLIKQEAMESKQDFCGHLKAENSHDVTLSFSKQTKIVSEGTPSPTVELPVSSTVSAEYTVKPNYVEHMLPEFTATADDFKFTAPAGGTMKTIKQEATAFRQDFRRHSVAENIHDAKFAFSKQTKIANGVLGETTKIIKQEGMEFKQDFWRHSMDENSHDVKFSLSKLTNIANGVLGETSSHMVKGVPNVHVLLKPEPVDYCDYSSAEAIRVACTVPAEDMDFLKLPKALSMKSSGTSRTYMRLKEDLVFLRDSAERLWPVIHHHRNDLMVLTSGWTAFKKASNIQPGDECTFTLESMEEGIFSVQIVHN